MVSYNDVLQLAEQLTVEEQQALARQLLSTSKPIDLTREHVLAEFERRKVAGEFDNFEILRNKYAQPDNDLSEEQLLATLHDIATEWEQELDEFFGDDN
jgi:hypothetical protein